MLLPRVGDSETLTWDDLLQWQPANYDNPIRRTWLIPYASALASITTVLVFIRLGLRFAKKGGGFGLDDAFLIPSYILLILYTACCSFGVDNGAMDRHVWDIRPQNWVIAAKLGWVVVIFFSAGTGVLKLSILCFYRRLIKGTYNRTWLISTWLAVAFIICYSLLFVLFTIFACWPVEAYWLSSDPSWAATHEYRCVTWTFGNILSGICNAISNLYSVVLPALVLWNLQLPRRQKIGLYIIFTLGGIDVILACLRTKYMWDFAVKKDPSWYGYDATAVSIAEWNIGMICACLPSLRVLFRTFFEYNNSNTGDARKAPRYVKPRKLNRIPSGESELPLAACRGEPVWLDSRSKTEEHDQIGIVRVREYAVE